MTGRRRCGTLGIGAGAALVIVAMVFLVGSAGASNRFPDVPDSHPFHDDIDWLAGEGITAGFNDGTFRPANIVTRQAIAAYLYRYAGEPAYTPPANATFPDVPTTHTFYKEIEWLNSTGITTGFNDGTFRPGNNVTRQSIAAYLNRYAGRPTFAAPGVATFPDVGVSHPFFSQIEWLNDNSVTTGFNDGTFRPGNSVTRQAFAAYLHRYDTNIGPSICLAQTDIAADECHALAAFYNDTDGPNWDINTGWMTPANPCTWHGVFCSAAPGAPAGPSMALPKAGPPSTVVNVSLHSNSLSGQLPAHLGDLTNLETLFLNINNLTGTIPAELTGLGELRTLLLGSNSLAGPIPPALGNLTNLESLNLSGNGFTGSVPASLGNLVEMSDFQLGFNPLSGPLPNSLANLTKLTTLGMDQAGITGPFPDWLGSMPDLRHLGLRSNHLTGPIPPELGNLTDLGRVILYDNDLTGPIPAELGNLTSLDWLVLHGNNLSGEVPGTLTNLTNLTYLTLYNNMCLFTPSGSLTTFLDSFDPNWDDGCTP